MIYWELFITFFKIGLFTIGGGYAMIPMINSEVVANGWLSQEMLIDFIAISESTPGPFAVNIATFVGSQVAGFFGAVCSTTALVLPSIIIIYIIARLMHDLMSKKPVQYAFSGLRPAVVALIAIACINIAVSTWFSGVNISDSTTFANIDYIGIILFAIILLLSKLKKNGKGLHPIFLILISAGLGIIGYGLLP